MEALAYDEVALTPLLKQAGKAADVELTDAEIEARIAAARAEGGGNAWPADRPREGKRTEPRGRPPGARRGGR